MQSWPSARCGDLNKRKAYAGVESPLPKPTGFCRPRARFGKICSTYRVLHQFSLESSGVQFWYEDCSRLYMLIAMKQPMINSDADQNWNWPANTWFQERLNAIKAREQELRRKPLVTVHKPATMMAEPHEKKEPVKVELSPKS